MEKPIAIVTGSSSGFGYLTVLELAKSGFHVVATMRDRQKAGPLIEEAKKWNLDSWITIHDLDVTQEGSSRNLSLLVEKMGRVDVLVNNAGYAAGGFVEEISLEAYRNQFETNVFGVIQVTKAVLPFMRKQGRGKIINVSSISGKMAFPGLSPYVASKHAIEGWSESLRLEMKPFGVDVVLVEPGSFKTNIWSTGKQVTLSEPDSPYYSYMAGIENYLEAGEAKYGDPREVSRKIVEIAKMNKPSLRFPIGKRVKMTIFLRSFIPWKLWEKIIWKNLT
ncbi:oxidoreductase [Neobacillus dielmonensis]|uniref:oxidoreductase n=1 Tax=Neobacillus dielmonensis TaxID=1347369 RepID=UPI0005A7434A|nr:oxidoreductase [Neobacillus dielmonensis]